LEVYDLLISGNGNALKWFCDKRETAMMSTHEVKSPMDNKINEITAMLEKILEKFDRIENRLAAKADSTVVADLEVRLRAIEERLSAPIAAASEVRTEEAPNKGDSRAEIVEMNLGEMHDRERRKNNIIVYNIRESTSECTDERKLHDMAEVTELVSSEMNISTVLSDPVRLGPKLENMKWPRPLRVTVDSESSKWKILKESKNLTGSRKESFRTIYIKRDMTRLERDHDRELRKQQERPIDRLWRQPEMDHSKRQNRGGPIDMSASSLTMSSVFDFNCLYTNINTITLHPRYNAHFGSHTTDRVLTRSAL